MIYDNPASLVLDHELELVSTMTRYNANKPKRTFEFTMVIVEFLHPDTRLAVWGLRMVKMDRMRMVTE